jgi:DHA1 family purine base/nucleoside efflux pump-like MFS transporter
MAGLSRSINTLFLGRFFMGLFGASVIPLGLILIAKHISKENRGKSIGMFFGFTFVASLLGLFLSGIIPWRWVFLIPAISGFILWLVMYFYLPSFKEDVSEFKFNYLKVFNNKSLVKIVVYIFIISLIYHAIQQWLGVYLSPKPGLAPFTISRLITLTALSGIIGEFWGGLLTDSLGRIRVVNFGIILMVLSIFSLILRLPLFVLVPIMIIWGLGWTFNHVGLATMLTDLPKEFINEAASLNSGVRFISGGVGMGLGGLIMSKSFNLGFIVFGSALLLLLIYGRFINIEK